jgi:hypothetical protein
MKTRATHYIAAMIVAIAILASCKPPLGVDVPTGPETDETGSVTFTVPVMSGRLLQAILAGADSGQMNAAMMRPQAFLLATSVEVRIYDSTDTLIATASSSDPSEDFISYEVNVTGLPSGGPYYAEVDVYNSSVSTTEPVASGMSDPFVVIPGTPQPVATVVLPNPTFTESLAADTPDDTTVTATIFSIYTGFDAIGGEAWYELVADNTGIMITSSTDEFSAPVFALFDANGAFLTAGVSGGIYLEPPGGEFPATATFGTTPGATYYIGAITIDDSGASATITTEWTGVDLSEDEDEPNETSGTAAEFPVGSTISRTIHDETDEDWYWLDLTGGTVYAMTLSMPGLPVPTAELEFDFLDTDATTEIFFEAGQYDIDSQTITVAWTIPADGIYYLHLAPNSSAPFLGPYTLRFGEPAAGDLEVLIMDFGEFGTSTVYFALTDVGGDPFAEAIGQCDGLADTLLTVDAVPGPGAWGGAGGFYDLYYLVDNDSSGGTAPTDGDYIGMMPIIVDGSTRVDLIEYNLGLYLDEDAYEPDEDSSDPTAFTLGSTIDRNIHDDLDQDWHEVSLTSGTLYSMILSGTIEDDPTDAVSFWLYESDGVTEVYNDVEQTNRTDGTYTCAWTAPATDTYYLVVSAEEWFPEVTPYTLTFGEPAAGDLVVTITDNAVGVGLGSETIYFYLTDVDGDPFTEAIGECSGLVDTLLTVNAIPGPGAWTGAGGLYDLHYLVDVDSSGGTAPTEGDYTGMSRIVVDGSTNVELMYFDLYPVVAADSYEPDDTFGTASSITVNDPPQDRTIHDDGADVDYVQFTADGTSAYTISMYCEFGSPDIYLLDSSLTEIGANWGYTGGTVTIEPGVLSPAGTYYVYVETWFGPVIYTLEVTSP